MKKVVFWLSFIPLGLFLIVLSCAYSIIEYMQSALYWWEAWCFDEIGDYNEDRTA